MRWLWRWRQWRDGFNDAAPNDDFTGCTNPKPGKQLGRHKMLVHLRAFCRPDAHEVTLRALAGAIIQAGRKFGPPGVRRGVGLDQFPDGHPPLGSFSRGWRLPLFELNGSFPLQPNDRHLGLLRLQGIVEQSPENDNDQKQHTAHGKQQ